MACYYAQLDMSAKIHTTGPATKLGRQNVNDVVDTTQMEDQQCCHIQDKYTDTHAYKYKGVENKYSDTQHGNIKQVAERQRNRYGK